MILAVEIEHEGWIHEECNAGMLGLLRESSAQELYFAAADSQIEAVKNVGVPDDVKYITISVPPRSMGEDMSNVDVYAGIIADAAEGLKLSGKDKIVFLSATSVIMKAAFLVNRQYHAKLFFVMHNYLEMILQNDDMGQQYKSIVTEVCNRDDAWIVVFNPYARQKLAGVIDGNLERILFLHHPMQESLHHPVQESDCRCTSTKTGKIVIGVYGNSINQNFFQILKRLTDCAVAEKVEFLIMRRTEVYNFDLTYRFPKNGVKIYQSEGFDRAFRIARIREMDYILLPYDYSMYQLSMSGILADAVRHEKPIIALNTSIVEYYNQMPIGIVEDSVEGLCDKIKRIDKNDENEIAAYRNNIRDLKKRIKQESVDMLKELLKP